MVLHHFPVPSYLCGLAVPFPDLPEAVIWLRQSAPTPQHNIKRFSRARLKQQPLYPFVACPFVAFVCFFFKPLAAFPPISDYLRISLWRTPYELAHPSTNSESSNAPGENKYAVAGTFPAPLASLSSAGPPVARQPMNGERSACSSLDGCWPFAVPAQTWSAHLAAYSRPPSIETQTKPALPSSLPNTKSRCVSVL
ncbi:hypothetical protein N657DRAFT_190828 [Parathielavia appendiculata]|uniref:Uncharacterized protein n=1 Tax=Parathielavia appendiculata TaxID=2587402 RepID=A0AAN6Z6Q3_9PEZI|nr:hypothetical protein N657DRAFT_190828 [Parathielavia appendiculata]